MSDYLVVLTCPACGHNLDHRADGRPQSGGCELHVVARCTGCADEWVVQVRLAAVHPNRQMKPRRMTSCRVCAVEYPAYYPPGGTGRTGKAAKFCSAECRAKWRKTTTASLWDGQPSYEADMAGVTR